MPQPIYPPRQCPACELWFHPRSHNTKACSVRCANKIKRQQLKLAETRYAASAPARPVIPAAILEQAQADVAKLPIGQAAKAEPIPETAESALERLGYSSRPREHLPTGPIPTVHIEPSAEPERGRLICGHRDIGVHPCPLCHPPVLETDNA